MKLSPKMFAAMKTLALEEVGQHVNGLTVAELAAAMECSPEAARKFLDALVDDGHLAKSPRPGEGATLYRRPSDYEKELNAWLGCVHDALKHDLAGPYKVSIAANGRSVSVTTSLEALGFNILAGEMPVFSADAQPEDTAPEATDSAEVTQ